MADPAQARGVPPSQLADWVTRTTGRQGMANRAEAHSVPPSRLADWVTRKTAR